MRPLVLVLCLLGATPATAAQLTLTWVDHADGQATFVIERATGTTGTFAYLAENPEGVVGYYDTTVSMNTVYCYRVAAVNDVGMSAYSNVACGKAIPKGRKK